MYTCPECRTKQKRRKDGRCPHCGVRVSVFYGKWVREDDGAPTVSLLRHVERLIGETLSREAGSPVVYYVPRRGMRYQRELLTAEAFLSEVEYDLETAKAVVYILLTHKRFSFKTRTGLMCLQYDFPLALAIYQQRKRVEQHQSDMEKAYLARINKEENLFA